MLRLIVFASTLALACALALACTPRSGVSTKTVTHEVPAPTTKVPAVQATAELAAPMAELSFLRGVWEGKAHGMGQNGPFEVTQVERVGPMLGGDILVIEGRGFHPDGTTGFNAFGIMSFDPRTHKYEMRSYAQGHSGTFEIQLTSTGFRWELPVGPKAVIRFTTTVQGDSWHEQGVLAIEGQPPKAVFEMDLHRVRDTDWPLGSPATPSGR
jgi:hypothetical protein